MTLKQFLYLAIGAGIAYLLFIFGAKSYPLLAWPGAFITASLGSAFAFLPISSRPLDYWLGAFLKAIYSPTKRTWKKNKQTFGEDSLFSSRLVTYFSSLQPQQPLPATATPAEDGKPKTEATPSFPTPAELGKTVDLARQAQNLQLKIIQTERTLNEIKSAASGPTAISVDYGEQVKKIFADLNTLVSRASRIKQELDTVIKSPRSQEFPSVSLVQEKVKIVVPAQPKQTQLALTTFPNVLNGIIKDKTGTFLENVVAVIYDKEGLPVRALKTNKLGQFSGSTPLPGGTYTLELEKDNFTFDVLQIELTGEVLPPLIITAK